MSAAQRRAMMLGTGPVPGAGLVSFNQIGTVSGRTTSSRPNIQQIPRGVSMGPHPPIAMLQDAPARGSVQMQTPDSVWSILKPTGWLSFGLKDPADGIEKLDGEWAPMWAVDLIRAFISAGRKFSFASTGDDLADAARRSHNIEVETALRRIAPDDPHKPDPERWAEVVAILKLETGQ